MIDEAWYDANIHDHAHLEERLKACDEAPKEFAKDDPGEELPRSSVPRDTSSHQQNLVGA